MAGERNIGQSIGRSRFVGAMAACSMFAILTVGHAHADATDMLAAPATAIPHRGSRIQFSIPPQSLMTALDEFNAATHAQILYDSRLVVGMQSPGVQGLMNADDALNAILAGTTLSSVRLPNGMLSLLLVHQDVKYASTLEIGGPMLQLDTIRVEGPAMFNYRYYARTVSYAIQGALQHDHTIRQSNYHLDVNVWVSPAGLVQRYVFLQPTGNDFLDKSIASLMKSVEIADPPPSQLPQPVHVRISAEGAD